jgi:hypothetical protein
MTKNRLKVPKVIFTNDLDMLANHLCFLAATIARDNYNNKGFTVLPYLIPDQTQTVYFPDFNYPKKFWRYIRKSGKSFGDKYPDEITKIVKNQLEIPPLKHFDITDFWGDLTKIAFFDLKINKITVLITNYGPGASFNFKDKELFIAFRADRSMADLPRSIVSALVYVKNGRAGKNPENYWKNRFYAEFLANETTLRKYCPPLSLPKLSPIDFAASKNYLQKLGLGNFKKLDQNLAKHLSNQEKAVFEELLKEKIVNQDRIAEILWGENEEKYSLWAITKLIQKIRNKVKLYGADPSQIKTVYGQGYILDF